MLLRQFHPDKNLLRHISKKTEFFQVKAPAIAQCQGEFRRLYFWSQEKNSFPVLWILSKMASTKKWKLLKILFIKNSLTDFFHFMENSSFIFEVLPSFKIFYQLCCDLMMSEIGNIFECMSFQSYINLVMKLGQLIY